MTTTKEACWAEVFPALPICAIPKNLPENITPEELIRFASDNVKSIVDSWTCAIRFRGVNGRLAMHEDYSCDVDYRTNEVNRAVRRALL